MSKFSKTKPKTTTKNYMGEKAVKHSPKYDIVNILLTSFVEDQYYESAKTQMNRLLELATKHPLFSAKASIYARKEFHMRSVTHLIGATIPHIVKGEPWVERFIEKNIFRVDDITEIMAYYLKNYGKPIPNSLKRGLAKSFEKFDEYQLAKYRGEGKKVSLVDVVNLVHPKHSEALRKLVNGELVSKDTWESKVSKAGKDSTAKAEAWADLVRSRKLGYFATLRNLNNIAEHAPEVLPEVAKFLTNPNAIKNSKVFPFRFITAMNAVDQKSRKKKIKFESDIEIDLQSILNEALTVSCQNIPLLEGKTAILADNSGSMVGDSFNSSLTSAMSNTNTAMIANLFSAMYWLRANDTYVGLFGDELISPKLDRTKTLLENYKEIQDTARKVGTATEEGIFDFFDELLETGEKVDRIIIFSDCQIGAGCCWYTTARYGEGLVQGDTFMRMFREYHSKNPETRVYTINLRSYGTTVFNGNIIKMGGFSDKIFEILEILEQDKNALIKKIEAIEL